MPMSVDPNERSTSTRPDNASSSAQSATLRQAADRAGRPLPDRRFDWQRALYPPLTILAWLVVLLIVGWALSHVTRTILVVVLAAVLAFAFTPLANLFARWLPRSLALGLAYLVGLGGVVGLGALLISTTAEQAAALVSSLPSYAQQAQSLQPQIIGLLGPFGIPPSSVSSLEQQALGGLQDAGSAIATQSLASVIEIFGTAVDLVLVLILSVYLAANGRQLARGLQSQTPSSQRHQAVLVVAVVNRVIGGYVRGVLLLALLVGAFVGIGLALLGVPYAVLLGVLAFFMEFIPVLGVFISGVAALGVAVFSFRDLLHPLLVLAYFVVVHIVEGDVVGPRIMGRAVGIHPATGLVALVAGTELFGIWGALFAAPIAGLLQAIVTAAWLEFRGGKPQEVLNAVADQASEHVEGKFGGD
jgi:predicted PurR-regulated permease PerM